jgi:predicted transcriptional regulator
MDKDAKEARDRRIFELWLACHTQQEIAEELGCPQQTVADLMKTFTENGRSAFFGKTQQAAADFVRKLP